MRSALIVRAAAALVLALLVASPSGTGDARSSGTRSCATPSGSVVANPQVRVIRRLDRRRVVRYVACARGTGRRIVLGPVGAGAERPYVGVENFTLAGGVLAYEEDVIPSSPRGPSLHRIVVRDVARGRLIARTVAYERRAEIFTTSAADGITDIEVTALGRAAWIVRNPYANPPTFEVYSYNDDGHELLDRGDAIASRSLRRRGCVVSWLNAGDRRNARIC